MIRYGYAPEAKECKSVPTPPSLQTKMSQSFMGFKPAMIDALNRPLPNVAVARQLNRMLLPEKNGPQSVVVPGYGTFRLGVDGWALDA